MNNKPEFCFSACAMSCMPGPMPLPAAGATAGSPKPPLRARNDFLAGNHGTHSEPNIDGSLIQGCGEWHKWFGGWLHSAPAEDFLKEASFETAQLSVLNHPCTRAHPSLSPAVLAELKDQRPHIPRHSEIQS